jgi:hypothetical protein
MVVTNLIARIMFYATAWCATAPINAGYLLDGDGAEDPEPGEEAADSGAGTPA